MKFNPMEWSPVKSGEKYSAYDRVQIRATEPCAVIVYQHGVEAVAGFGPVHEIEVNGEFWFEVEGAGRAFVRKIKKEVIEPSGEVFTNIDRMPMESGTVSETVRQLRMFKLEQQRVLREMRALQSVKELDSARKDVEGEPIEESNDEQKEPKGPQKEIEAQDEKTVHA